MTRKEIGKICKKKRGETSTYMVAKYAQLSIGQINRIESGEQNYTIDVLFKHLNAIGLKIKIVDE